MQSILAGIQPAEASDLCTQTLPGYLKIPLLHCGASPIPKLMGLPHCREGKAASASKRASRDLPDPLPASGSSAPPQGPAVFGPVGLALTSASLGKESSTNYEGFAFIWAEAGCGKGEDLRALCKLLLIARVSGSKLDPYLSLWTYENRMLGVLVPKDLTKLMLNNNKKKK